MRQSYPLAPKLQAQHASPACREWREEPFFSGFLLPNTNERFLFFFHYEVVLMRLRMKAGNILAVAAVCAVIGAMLVGQAQGGQIFSDGFDGFIEVRDNLPPVAPWPKVHPSYDGSGGEGWFLHIGEWYGPGLTVAVLPFELPNFGAVANPFVTANLGINLFTVGGSTVTDVDLYGVRVDSDPTPLASDFYIGSAPDPSATLIQASFLTPASTTAGPGPNNFTDATGDANLVSFLNASYAGGANAGKFAFLRLSYGADTFAAGWDAYDFTSSNFGPEGDWPVITYTVPEPASVAMLVLGIAVLGGSRRR